MLRRCSVCEKSLPTSEFYPDSRVKDGLRRMCRTCHGAKSYESRIKNSTPTSRSNRERARNLSRKYGISVDEYKKMYKEQNGVCKLCGNPQVENYSRVLIKTPGFELAVDHNHETGRIRGLLCTPCNLGLGQFKDSIELLEKAISYLRDTCCEGEACVIVDELASTDSYTTRD
jgi:Recombination endonuclease VII